MQDTLHHLKLTNQMEGLQLLKRWLELIAEPLSQSLASCTVTQPQGSFPGCQSFFESMGTYIQGQCDMVRNGIQQCTVEAEPNASAEEERLALSWNWECALVGLVRTEVAGE